MSLHIRSHRALAVASTLAVLGACQASDVVSPAGDLGADDGAPLFLTQGAPATATMQALFEGDVTVDPSGCIRLESPVPDNSTVVWPFGFALSGSTVGDAQGTKVGELGGRFRFGGGHVPHLLGAFGLTTDQITAVQARCPGSFWIVGEILR